MTNISITSPVLTDIDTLWRRGEENWELWGDDVNKWFTKESLKIWLSDSKDDILLVVRDDKKLIGMCFTHVMPNWSFCFGLFVEKEYRGKSIGKQLISETEKRLKKKGIKNFTLLVDIKNDKALKFYLREGFYKGFPFYMMSKNY